MLYNDDGVPVDAIRVGSGQFLLAGERVAVDLLFVVVDGQTFRIASEPVAVATGTYLATVIETEGPTAGRQLTARLQVGRRVN